MNNFTKAQVAKLDRLLFQALIQYGETVTKSTHDAMALALVLIETQAPHLLNYFMQLTARDRLLLVINSGLHVPTGDNMKAFLAGLPKYLREHR
jgi:hypothetical protein